MSNSPKKADAASAAPTISFVPETEYIFSMRSFRVRNNFTFATVSYKDTKLEILIGSSTDYNVSTMLQAKQFGGSIYATFKNMTNVNGVDYPRFWDVSIG